METDQLRRPGNNLISVSKSLQLSRFSGKNHTGIYHCLLIAAMTFILYYPIVLQTYWQDDDFHWLVRAHEIVNNPGAILQPTYGFFRPLTALTFTVSFYFFYLNALPFHFLQVAMHAINSILVYTLAWKLTKHRLKALAAGLFYSLAVSHDRAVVWLCCMTEIYAGFFALLFLNFLADKFVIKKSRHAITGYIILIFSLISKAINILLPVLTLLFIVLFTPAHGPVKRFSLRPHARFIVTVFLITFVYGCLIYFYPTYTQGDITGFNRKFWEHVNQVVFPGLSEGKISHYLSFSGLSQNLNKLFSKYAGITTSFIVLVILMIHGYRNRAAGRIVCFVSVWMFSYLVLVSVSPVYRPNQWYHYVPNIGFAILLVEFVFFGISLFTGSRWGQVIAGICIIFLLTAQFVENRKRFNLFYERSGAKKQQIELFVKQYPRFDSDTRIYFMGAPAGLGVPVDFYKVLYGGSVTGEVVVTGKPRKILNNGIPLNIFRKLITPTLRPGKDYVFTRRGNKWYDITINTLNASQPKMLKTVVP